MSSIRTTLSKVPAGLSKALATYRDNHLRKSRMKVGHKALLVKQGKHLPISNSQREEILSFWRQYRDVSKYMPWFEFYNWCSDGKADIKYYIPDDIYYAEVDFFFTSPRRSYELDDKNLYDLYFHGIRMPKTVIRKSNGLLMDKDYHVIDLQRAIELCREAQHVISKPARNSEGGKGIQFIDFDQDNAVDALKECLQYPFDLIVQEIVKQHDAINQLYDKSVNSIRIMSIILDGKIHIVSSVIRMGRDGAKVDNTSHGGLVCGLTSDGKLRDTGFDKTGTKWTKHPQGAVFKDFQIVGYDKCVDVIHEVAGRLGSTTLLISWDFAIDQDGEPVIIEANMTFGGVNIHQMCNGPIFGDLTEDILSRVYHSTSKS